MSPMINLTTEDERNEARARWCQEPLTGAGEMLKLALDALEFSIGQRDTLNNLLADTQRELETRERLVNVLYSVDERLPEVLEGYQFSAIVLVFYEGCWVAGNYELRPGMWRLHNGTTGEMVELSDAPLWKLQPPAPRPATPSPE